MATGDGRVRSMIQALLLDPSSLFHSFSALSSV